jgi:membrane-associated phospholipid phosphatase
MNAVPAIADEARPWRRAALWLIFLGLFFFITYNAANGLASRRADVGVVVFGWERGIPYLPWTIVPYWSIDLFYAVSVFVCATRRELDTHARRLFATQIVAVACFVLFPLRQTFTRPETGGFYGWMLDALLAFDKPFNQAPALHIALLVVLWVLYAQHLRGPAQGWLRWVLHAWFALIGLSVLTTYQHHFIDVPTGLLLGWFCVWLFPDDQPSLPARAAFTRHPRRRALAASYLAGALLTAALAIAAGGWELWLLWISTSLALVAVIYGWLDAAAFGKRADGGMQPAALGLLAPYLLGAALNSRGWTRRSPAAGWVTPEIGIGRIPWQPQDIPAGVRTIVDLCAELPCKTLGVRYVCLPALDLVPLDVHQLDGAVSAIFDAAQQGPVLVCCALGYSRSASAVAAWLVASGRCSTAEEAMARVLEARPHAVLSNEQRAALTAFASARRVAQ